MTSKRTLFLQQIGQTSELPLGLEVSHAEGMYIHDTDGNKYLDLNSGISVSSLGHRNPHVVEAIKKQVDKYLHTMVYGEHIQSPQMEYASLLLPQLGERFEKIYFVMTGSEAVEVSLKMARLHKGRAEIIASKQAYHGSTAASESLRSDVEFMKYMAPGIPAIKHIEFNNIESLNSITEKTAAVITEPVQAERGVICPTIGFLKALRQKCDDVGALLIFDEIQTGFYRTGKLFAHQKYDVKPDLLLIAKSMGGGMPIGAVVSSTEIMQSIVKNPALAHITTFGGHPVSAAAATATLGFMLKEEFNVLKKEELIHQFLQHNIIKEIRSSGLMMAVELTKRKFLKHVVEYTINHGALIDFFLFNNRSFRLAPPLIITEKQIKEGCNILLAAMDYAESMYN